MVPDSSCTATALLCGSKTNQEVVGVDASVKLRDCAGSLKPEARLKSLAADALNAGKSAGTPRIFTLAFVRVISFNLFLHKV